MYLVCTGGSLELFVWYVLGMLVRALGPPFSPAFRSAVCVHLACRERCMESCACYPPLFPISFRGTNLEVGCTLVTSCRRQTLFVRQCMSEV